MSERPAPTKDEQKIMQGRSGWDGIAYSGWKQTCPYEK
jgi:hypothetical protein